MPVESLVRKPTDTKDRGIVSSRPLRSLTEMYPPEGSLPSLRNDVLRDMNYLAHITTRDGVVVIKEPAFAYPKGGKHLLVMPFGISAHSLGTEQAVEKTPKTSSVTDVPRRLLATTFATVGAIAEQYADDPTIQKITTGFNHSPAENKKHVATQVDTLHVHVAAYGENDVNTVTAEQVGERPELWTKEKEPYQDLITSILEEEVFAELESTKPGFRERFKRVNTDKEKRRITYEMRKGILEFNNPDLADMMQTIHKKTLAAYLEVASCFFKRKDQTDSQDTYPFAQTGEAGRFELLPQADRERLIEAYIARKPYIREGSAGEQLKHLATNAKPMEEIHAAYHAKVNRDAEVARELTVDEKYGRNPAMALKGLAYAAVMTGVRQADGQFSWQLGFDPVLFAPRDVIQASRDGSEHPTHFERDETPIMEKTVFTQLQEYHTKLVEKIPGTQKPLKRV